MLPPSHSTTLANDLNRSLLAGSGEIQPRPVRSDCPPAREGRLSGRAHLAVAGHSMGGGVALLAAARSRAVDTVVTLAAAETVPRASVAVRRLRVPSLFVVGSDDGIVPAAGTAVMFRRAPSPFICSRPSRVARTAVSWRSSRSPAMPAGSPTSDNSCSPASNSCAGSRGISGRARPLGSQRARRPLKSTTKKALQMPSSCNPKAHRT